MNKQITGLILLIVANIMLLVHAVVSHHYHQNSSICFEKTHCENSHEKFEYPLTEHNHKHDGDTDNCLLKQAVAVPIYVNKQIYGLDNNSTDHINFQLILFLSDANYNFTFLKNIYSYFSYIKFHYIYFVNHCIGLRAPPVV